MNLKMPSVPVSEQVAYVRAIASLAAVQGRARAEEMASYVPRRLGRVLRLSVGEVSVSSDAGFRGVMADAQRLYPHRRFVFARHSSASWSITRVE